MESLVIMDVMDTSSFSLQLKIILPHLKKRANVTLLPYTSYRMAEKLQPDALLLWAGVVNLFNNEVVQTVKHLKRNGTRIGFFYVSDGLDMEPGFYEGLENMDPDVILTPSEWSRRGIKWDNVKVFPHAVSIEPAEPRRLDKLTFMTLGYHDDLRKNYTAVSYVLKRVKGDFIFLNATNMPGFPPVDLKSRKHLAELHATCDYFISLARGGAFEIPILDTLASGGKVIVPDRGPWTEYVRPQDAVFIKSKPGGRVYTERDLFTGGEMLKIDYDDAINKITSMMGKRIFPSPERMEYYRTRFSPEVSASRVLEIMFSV